MEIKVDDKGNMGIGFTGGHIKFNKKPTRMMNKEYSCTYEIYDAMQISWQSLFAIEDEKTLITGNILLALENMKKQLDNIIGVLKK